MRGLGKYSSGGKLGKLIPKTRRAENEGLFIGHIYPFLRGSLENISRARIWEADRSADAREGSFTPIFFPRCSLPYEGCKRRLIPPMIVITHAIFMPKPSILDVFYKVLRNKVLK